MSDPLGDLSAAEAAAWNAGFEAGLAKRTLGWKWQPVDLPDQYGRVVYFDHDGLEDKQVGDILGRQIAETMKAVLNL